MEVDYQATVLKWTTAIKTFRINISEVSRDARVTRQHVTNIMNGASIPSMLVAERIDHAIDAAVGRRREIARKALEIAQRPSNLPKD